MNNFFKKIYRRTAFLLILAAAAGCAQQTDQPPQGARLIVATIFPLADWCRHIAPDDTHVFTLVPPNQNPHLYEPNVKTMKHLNQADFVVRMGYGFDDWVHPLITNAQNAKTALLVLEQAERGTVFNLELSGSVPDPEDNSSTHNHFNNPHLWLDPIWAQDAVQIISTHLQKRFPNQAERIQQRTRDYKQQLAALHQEIAQTIQSLPYKQYVGYHGAFIPFAERYGLEETASIEPWPGKEPSIRRIQSIIETLQSLPQPVIFIEPQLNEKAAEIFAKEANARVLSLDPIGDPSDPERSSYIRLMRFNLNAFVQGLSEKIRKDN